MADKCNDLGALLSANGLVLPFDMALYAGWVDGELASLANDDLTFPVVYKQFLEYIYNVSCIWYANYERIVMYAAYARVNKRSRLARVPTLTWGMWSMRELHFVHTCF